PLSFSVPLSSLNPSAVSACSAALRSRGYGFSFALNQNLLAGGTAPIAGEAGPREKNPARSPRTVAFGTARREVHDTKPSFLYCGMGADGTWLNHICSVSVETPMSRTPESLSADILSKRSGGRALIRWISPRRKRRASVSRLAWMSRRMESILGCGLFQ